MIADHEEREGTRPLEISVTETEHVSEVTYRKNNGGPYG